MLGWGSASVEVITLLLTAYYPEAARFKDKDICKRDDKLPLLYACEKSAPVETITALLIEYPEAARERDVSSSLPIHWTCSNNAPIAVIAALLSAYPEAAQDRAKDDKLPLYIACENSDVGVAAMLLDFMTRGVTSGSVNVSGWSA